MLWNWFLLLFLPLKIQIACECSCVGRFVYKQSKVESIEQQLYYTANKCHQNAIQNVLFIVCHQKIVLLLWSHDLIMFIVILCSHWILGISLWILKFQLFNENENFNENIFFTMCTWVRATSKLCSLQCWILCWNDEMWHFKSDLPCFFFVLFIARRI